MSRETERMGCRRAFDVDLVACLLDRDRPEWQDFRDHYPTCPECASEVRTWTELQVELAPAHPAPARLVRYQDAPASLRAEERHAIREHVEACTACRDELHMLRTTDLPALVRAGTAVATPLRTSAAVPPRRHAPRRRLGSRLRAFVWRPGVAYALALLLLVPALAPYRHVLVPAAPPERRTVRLAPHGELRRAARPDLALGDAAAPEPPATAALEAKTRRAEEQAPAAPAVWPRLDLTPSSTHLVIAASPGLVVTLPAPGGAVTAGPAELRIHDATGRRELREAYFGPPTSRFALHVPSVWLEPGRYVVELYVGDEKPAATATLDVAARSPS
jgi:hypothetical protein